MWLSIPETDTHLSNLIGLLEKHPNSITTENSFKMLLVGERSDDSQKPKQ